MNREIKFRVFDPATNLFVTPELFTFNANFTEKWFRGNYKLHKYSHSDKCLISQFIGLIDKNGKEIYEGDIVVVSENSKIHIVKYINTGFVLTASNGNIMVYIFNNSILEVVGNIFENPELLEK